MPTDEKSQAQEERLIYIDFFLYFFGSISRNDLMTRFGIKQAAATRDISLYRERAPYNLAYDTVKKTYQCSHQFKPQYPYDVHHVLTCISRGFSAQTFHVQENALLLCETPQILNNPDLDAVSVITRAIKQNRVVRMHYASIRDKGDTIEFAPFSLVDNGLRWHVRGFSRARNEFCDCVLTRISEATLRDEAPQKHETKESDNQWNRIVTLELIPHPDMKNPLGIIADHNMIDGKKRVEMRAAVVGYFLRLWNVDCSIDRNLRKGDAGKEYQLCLGNLPALYDVKNANLAPGYETWPEDMKLSYSAIEES